MADKKKQPDFVFSDGVEVFFDFTKITVQEWRDFGTTDSRDDEDKTIARVGGFDPAKIPSMNYAEHNQLIQKFFEKAANPLSAPN